MSFLSDAILRQRVGTAEDAARAEAALASRMKTAFVSNMSHELRTPLNTVMGFSKLLSEHEERRLTDTQIVQYAGMIHEAAGQLLAVINDILDISRIQSGACAFEPQDVSISEALDAALYLYQPQAAEAGVDLRSEIDAGLPHTRGDGVRLRQAFVNLISNAIKFTRPGGQVSVSATAQAGAIVITIRDTGVGMSPEDISVALSVFGQIDDGPAQWREGAGLGLPIARSLIELHGGELHLKSVKGQGTEVTVRLPAATLRERALETAAERTSAP